MRFQHQGAVRTEQPNHSTSKVKPPLTLHVGMQGNLGSSNHRAALCFAERHAWENYVLVPLATSERVLSELNAGEITLGTIAVESNKGLVQETQIALRNYPEFNRRFEIVDKVKLEMNHSLLLQKGKKLDLKKKITVISHPQAIAGHKDYLSSELPLHEFLEEIDTALAAENLAEGKYPKNSVVIAPKECVEIYGLDFVIEWLPSNQGYWTEFWLIGVLDDWRFG